MPRCYMVKKQSSNKYQSTVMRDCWDQTTTSSTSPTTTTASSSAAATATVVAPESPTEGCVAPPCYTPLTNRSSYSQDFIPNGSVDKNSLLQSVRSEDITSGSDGEIPIFRTRSAEETEAAHDLLSLSQSLPPLPAPSVVMIHQTVPNEEEPLSPNHCYRPLSPDPATQPKYNKRTITPPPPPPTTVTVPCYTTPPIVYVVQVPAAVPTPPTSECSSDAENLQICGSGGGGGGGGHPTVQHHQTLSDNHNDDILILPLSPEPDSHLGGITVQETLTTTATTAAATITATHHSNIVSTTENGSPVTQETVIASSHLNIPDRRKRKNKRTNKTNKTYKNNNDNSTADNNIDSISDDAASKTKFYKVVADDPEELSDNTETTDPTSDTIPITVKASRYVCGECGKQYATSSNLSRHKQTHRSLDSQSAKKCMTCGKAYVSMPALAMHLLTHKLAHGCGICGKQFSRPWLLQGHLRSHTGEKPYGCAHCGKAFADRSNLRAHMQTHSGDKNFSCPKCHKTFALKSYLNKHQESACMVWDAKMKSYKRMTVHAETQTVTVG